jgi:hypothetical protein
MAAGYYWKMDGATLAIGINEGTRPHWNDPDWRLGWKAAWLGTRLKGGPIYNLNLRDVPDWIRNNLRD